MLINTVYKVVHPNLLQYAHACAVYSLFTIICIHIPYTYVHGLVNCVDRACCILVSVHIPTGYGIVDSLSLKISQNFYKVDTRCDILLFECPKIPSRRFCVLLIRKQEELNSWILRLGKAGLVVTQTSDRRPQTSLYKKRERLSVV